MHEVSILDVDKSGSLNLDADSDEGTKNRAQIRLEGDLGEGDDQPILMSKDSG